MVADYAECVERVSGTRYSKYDLALVFLVQIVFDMATIESINWSQFLTKWEVESRVPGLIVEPVFAAPVLVICELALLFVLLVVPNRRRIVLYTLFSASVLLVGVSLRYRLWFLSCDRFVAGSLTACSAVVIAVQLALVAGFILESVRQKAGHSGRKEQ